MNNNRRQRRTTAHPRRPRRRSISAEASPIAGFVVKHRLKTKTDADGTVIAAGKRGILIRRRNGSRRSRARLRKSRYGRSRKNLTQGLRVLRLTGLLERPCGAFVLSFFLKSKSTSTKELMSAIPPMPDKDRSRPADNIALRTKPRSITT